MSMPIENFSIRALIALEVLSLLVFLSPLSAQEERRVFPSRDYMVRLVAEPHEPVIASKLVYNAKGPSEFGNTVEGEVVLGATLPIYVISGSSLDDALVVGVKGAVFGRFTLTTITRDLITTDWVFAVPFTWHVDDSWVRLQYHHRSAHLGDEYVARFDLKVGDYSRDAVNLTVLYQTTPSLGLYWGGDWGFNVHPDGSRRFVLRSGVQAEDRGRDGLFQPYGAIDVQWEQDNAWRPRMNAQVGLRFPNLTAGRTFRLALEFLTGPSYQGQFSKEKVRHFTLGFHIDP